MTCSTEGCERAALKKGLCNTHYMGAYYASHRAAPVERAPKVPYVPSAETPYVGTIRAGDSLRCRVDGAWWYVWDAPKPGHIRIRCERRPKEATTTDDFRVTYRTHPEYELRSRYDFTPNHSAATVLALELLDPALA
jgi:hypothetical protein